MRRLSFRSSLSAPHALGAVFFANGLGFASWAARVPAVRERLQLADGELGTALFAMGLGAVLAFTWAGRVLALVGARALTLVAAAAYCVLLAQPALAANGWMLAFTLLLFGAANGAMDVAMNALAVEVEAQAQRPVMSWLHGMWSAGGLVGATLGAAAAAAGWSAALHLGVGAAGLAVLIVVVARSLPATPPVAVIAPPASTASLDAPRGLHASLARLADLNGMKGLWGLGAIIFASFLIEGAMADWSAVLMRDGLGATPAQAALGYSAFALAMMVLRLAGDRLVGRFGAVPLLRGANLAAALVLATALAAGSAALAMPAFVLVGLGVATIAPLVFRTAAQRAPTGGDTGRAIAAMATLGYGGFLAGPALIGWLAQATSLRAGMGVLVALALVLVALAGQLKAE